VTSCQQPFQYVRAARPHKRQKPHATCKPIDGNGVTQSLLCPFFYTAGGLQEEQQARLRQLSEAEGRLSAVKAQAPASTHSQQSAMQLRLSAAEQQVQEAAAAAQEATQKLQAVLHEKEEVQAELAALRQQLEAQPAAAAQHAELYTRLLVSAWLDCCIAATCRVLTTFTLQCSCYLHSLLEGSGAGQGWYTVQHRAACP